jgi:anti-sigma regulatory factor (Ser/Thr protein kinase)
MTGFHVGSGYRNRVPAVQACTMSEGRAVPPSTLPCLGEPRDNAVCVLPCEPDSAARARAAAAQVLARWAEEVPEQVSWDVVTVVSELVANAYRHGLPQATCEPPWRVVLGLMRTEAHLVCVVSDPGEGPLRLRPLNHSAESGRGLHIVGKAAQAWGWYSGDVGAGKVVWAVFDAVRGR